MAGKFAKVKDIISRWEEQFPNGKYFYRGQSRVYSSGTSAAAYRQVPSSLLRTFPDKKEYGSMQELEERLVSCALFHFPPHTSFFEARTEARHLGIPTNCIDFSASMLVALFFACRKPSDSHGEMLFLKIADMPFVPALRQDLLATSGPPRSDIVIVEASHTEYTEYHNRLQSSVLVLPQKGCLEFAEHDTDEVLEENKDLFKKYLKEEKDISEDTLFNYAYPQEDIILPTPQRRIPEDFPKDSVELGKLLRNHVSLISSKDSYQNGKGHYCHGEYEKALKSFQDAAKPFSPSSLDSDFHRFLTSTYLRLGKYPLALRQLAQLPRNEWSDVDHFMAAEGSFYLNDIEAALSNMRKAIEKNPRRPIYHRALMAAAVSASDYDSAEEAAVDSYSSSLNSWDFDRLLAEIERLREQRSRKGSAAAKDRSNN